MAAALEMTVGLRGENREPNLFTRICGSTPSPDGNRWSKVRFAPDSSLERDGFEPLVPLRKGTASSETTLIDLRLLLLPEDQATPSRE
jgi:hypothetical protein